MYTGLPVKHPRGLVPAQHCDCEGQILRVTVPFPSWETQDSERGNDQPRPRSKQSRQALPHSAPRDHTGDQGCSGCCHFIVLRTEQDIVYPPASHIPVAPLPDCAVPERLLLPHFQLSVTHSPLAWASLVTLPGAPSPAPCRGSSLSLVKFFSYSRTTSAGGRQGLLPD